jgi:hypothetical protein
MQRHSAVSSVGQRYKHMQFGVRAVDSDGNRSPVTFPQTVTT